MLIYTVSLFTISYYAIKIKQWRKRSFGACKPSFEKLEAAYWKP